MNVCRLLQISRPAGYIVAPIIFLTAVLLSHTHITLLILFQTLVLTFPLCFLIFGINDLFDVDTDQNNPRKGKLDGAIINCSEKSMIIRWSIYSAIVMLIPSIVSLNMGALVISLILIAISVIYSAPPRLKEIPPLDSLSNAFIIFLIFKLGVAYATESVVFPIKFYFLLLGVAAIHILGAVMDYTPDKKSHVRTFATLFGKRCSALASLLIFLFVILFSGIESFVIHFFLYYMFIISVVVFFYPNEKFVRYCFLGSFLMFIICSMIFIYSIF